MYRIKFVSRVVLCFAIGALLSFFAPFVGLQVSPVLAYIMMPMMVIVYYLFDTPIGEMDKLSWLFIFLLNSLLWSVIFWFVLSREEEISKF